MSTYVTFTKAPRRQPRYTQDVPHFLMANSHVIFNGLASRGRERLRTQRHTIARRYEAYECDYRGSLLLIFLAKSEDPVDEANSRSLKFVSSANLPRLSIALPSRASPLRSEPL